MTKIAESSFAAANFSSPGLRQKARETSRLANGARENPDIKREALLRSYRQIGRPDLLDCTCRWGSGAEKSKVRIQATTPQFPLRKEHKDKAVILPTLALYWADGKRTLAEIIELVELESGERAEELLLAHFELLEKMVLVELHEQAISSTALA